MANTRVALEFGSLGTLGMASEPQIPAELSGWKDIAKYLGVSVRTAQNWERDQGLPVQRMGGQARGTILARTADLDQWKAHVYQPAAAQVRGNPQRKGGGGFVRRRFRVASIGILVLASVIGLVVFRTSNYRYGLVNDVPDQVASAAFPMLVPLIVDERNIYVQEAINDLYRMIRISLAQPSTSASVSMALDRPDPGVVARDGSGMLLRNIADSEHEDQPLYFQPLPSGPAKRLGTILAYDSAWTPDAKHILFSSSKSVYEADTDGMQPRKLFDVPGRAHWFRWAPDGKKFRFTVYDSRLARSRIWEASLGGGVPRVVEFGIGSERQCCGAWTVDGRHFVFQAQLNGVFQLFVHSEVPGLFGVSTTVPLTSGVVNFKSPVPTFDGTRLIALSQNLKSEIAEYDRASRRWLPLFEGIAAASVAFSRDGTAVAYTRSQDSTLWRCEMPRCKNSVQLTFGHERIVMPRWSPDGKQIACMKQLPGEPWRVSVVASGGGQLIDIVAGDQAVADPSWSPDGGMIAFGPPSSPGPEKEAAPIRLLDLRTKEVQAVPRSTGYNTPVWSPNGRLLAGVHSGDLELAIYDFSTQAWKSIPGTRAGYLNWSSDGKRVYFLNLVSQTERSVMALDIGTFKTTTVAALAGLHQPAFSFGNWVGISPSETPLALRDLSTEEIVSWRVSVR